MKNICVPGKNGIITVIGGLYLWQRALAGKKSAAYDEAMEDVLWVLTQGTESVEEGVAGASKRRRT